MQWERLVLKQQTPTGGGNKILTMASFWSGDEASRLRGLGLTQRRNLPPVTGDKEQDGFLAETIHDVVGVQARDRKLCDRIYL